MTQGGDATKASLVLGEEPFVERLDPVEADFGGEPFRHALVSREGQTLAERPVGEKTPEGARQGAGVARRHEEAGLPDHDELGIAAG